MLDLLQLIPTVEKWRNSATTGQLDILDYVAYTARVSHLLFAIDTLWPNFIEKDDLILRESGVPQDWDGFMTQAKDANWSASDIEYVINHIHIADLFPNDPDADEISIDVYVAIADTMASMWRARLSELFPTQAFEIGVKDREEAPEVYAYRL